MNIIWYLFNKFPIKKFFGFIAFEGFNHLHIHVIVIRYYRQLIFKRLVTLGKTLYQWREEVVRMWRFTKNNGITEGFHRKMKLIQRRAYGFRNFENYRLRVRVLCG